METIINLLYNGIIVFTILFFIFLIVMNKDIIINFIKDRYEYFRKCFCKKGYKVNDDSGTVYNGPEFYDSSSEWED